MNLRIYRRCQLVGPNGLTGLSKSTIRRQIIAGTFPAPVPLGDRAVGWPSEAIDQWLAARAASTASAGGISARPVARTCTPVQAKEGGAP